MGNFNLDEIEPILTKDLSEIGLSLYDLEFKREAVGLVFRVFIEKDGPVGVDDCSKASSIVSKRLDDLDMVDSKYYLEISSPGLQRGLKRPAHFEASQGRKIKIKVSEPIFGKKTFEAIILAADSNGITLSVEGQIIDIGYDRIVKANQVFEF